jgi:hypothetical protein
MTAPCSAPVLWSLEWNCLGTGSVVAISPWIGQYSVTRMDAHSEIFILLFFLMAREFLSFQVSTHQEKKCERQRNLVARGIETVCECLGRRICADKSASATHVVAERIGEPFPRRVTIWHLSNGKKLFHSHGDHGELPVHIDNDHHTVWGNFS